MLHVGIVGSSSYKNLEAVRERMGGLPPEDITIYTGDVSDLNREIESLARHLFDDGHIKVVGAHIDDVTNPIERAERTQEADNDLIATLKGFRENGEGVLLIVFQKSAGSIGMVTKAIGANIPCEAVNEAGETRQVWPPPKPAVA